HTSWPRDWSSDVCSSDLVSLARMRLRHDSVVWDIGAGSGSVGLEAARLCPQGHVYAIEKNEADHEIAGSNHAAFGVSNYTLFLRSEEHTSELQSRGHLVC